jgi:hypothetical protein
LIKVIFVRKYFLCIYVKNYKVASIWGERRRGGAAGRQKWRKERERRIEMERLEEEKNKS